MGSFEDLTKRLGYVHYLGEMGSSNSYALRERVIELVNQRVLELVPETNRVINDSESAVFLHSESGVFALYSGEPTPWGLIEEILVLSANSSERIDLAKRTLDSYFKKFLENV